MIRFVNILLVFSTLACSPKTPDPTRTPEEQAEIDRTLAEDRNNKELELFYLAEIRVAQENNDTETFEFFFDEYLKVPRMDIPEWMKDEPNYFQGGESVQY